MNKEILILMTLLVFFITGEKISAESLPAEEENWKTLYDQPFEEIEYGELPEDFFVLEGNFQVTNKDGRKCLALAANPVGEHGFLFGPRIKGEMLEFSFSCLGGLKSRRHNVFAGALGGIRGLKFRINPSIRESIFSFQEDWRSSFPLKWSSQEWMKVVMVTKWDWEKEETLITMKIAREREPEYLVDPPPIFLNEKIPSGKCALWGFSYAEMNMYWDNLKIRTKNKISQ